MRPPLNGVWVALVLLVPGLGFADARLTAGPATLSFPSSPAGVSVSTGAAADYVQDRPAVVVTDGGTVTAAGYDHVTASPATVVATAKIATAAGSRFAFTDTWTVAGDGFRLARRVTVTAVGPGDRGFDTRFGLRPATAGPRPTFDLFMPGVWYRQNEHVVLHAIGADPSVHTYLTKETRLALPLVMIRPKGGGPSVTILHVDAHPATTLNDADPQPQIDAGIRYGSIGPYAEAEGFAVGLCYPGTEGERSYGRGGAARFRYHPVRVGVPHGYDLLIRPRPAAADFPTAMTDAWRAAYATYAPAVRPAPSSAVYHDGLAVFDKYYRADFPGGGCGLPFMVWLGLHAPRGQDPVPPNPASGRGVSDYHLQGGWGGVTRRRSCASGTTTRSRPSDTVSV